MKFGKYGDYDEDSEDDDEDSENDDEESDDDDASKVNILVIKQPSPLQEL